MAMEADIWDLVAMAMKLDIGDLPAMAMKVDMGTKRPWRWKSALQT